ncbi:MAG: hypothetical protein EZS28_034070 [Streblomastix strix]|uniref:Uncharacterized protein n=1 Tax=Streblomastix strix TaxID=222440 RepID=A0A5J4UJJ3_9EUKA|nr:MAG: hypothetical protein EZS28_034070 [Streblomastix strix]
MKNDTFIITKSIENGIIEALFSILKTRDLNQITDSFILAFGQPASCSDHNIKKYYFDIQSYPVLIRLFNHTDIKVIQGSIIVIYNILIVGSTAETSKPHQHFEVMVQCDGINKIFALFQHAENSEIKNVSAVCIGRLFKSREIENQQMRSEIITYLKTMVNNPEYWERNESRKDLKGLALNAANRIEIEAGGFVIPEVDDD